MSFAVSWATIEHILTAFRVTSEPVLKEIDLKVSHGEKVALCGRTGRSVSQQHALRLSLKMKKY